MIPNVFHFCYGLAPGSELHFFQYLAVKSACMVNAPERIYFYYDHEPTGVWWQKVKKIVTPIKIDAPKAIFGNPLQHFAHKADVVRLQKLNETGGVYLDLDTICLRPFHELLNNEFVMAKQATVDHDDFGLCNAIMLAQPGSFFGRTWYDEYRTFRSQGRDAFWDEHSVRVPLKLADRFPDRITVLDENSFFFPIWSEIEKILFREKILFTFRTVRQFKRLFADSYAIHLWETVTLKRLVKITPQTVLSERNMYSYIAKRFLMDEEASL